MTKLGLKESSLQGQSKYLSIPYKIHSCKMRYFRHYMPLQYLRCRDYGTDNNTLNVCVCLCVCVSLEELVLEVLTPFE